MANRKRRPKRNKRHDVDLKLQKKERVSDKKRADILKRVTKDKPIDVNQNFKPINQQGLRRGDR